MARCAADEEVIAAGEERLDLFDQAFADRRVHPFLQMRAGVEAENDRVGLG